MDLYFDKEGKSIKSMKWCKLFEDMDYKIIKQETLSNGFRVSTVWLGIDHSFGSGRPLIFETMVFPTETLEEQDTNRYSTLEEAIKGHEAMTKKWKGETIWTSTKASSIT